MKILLLGSASVGADDIVITAKKNNHYIIVADNIKGTRSKQYADESWDISTADIFLLKKKIEEEKVEAVIAAVSEFNWIQAIKLSNMCNLKTCIDKKLWELFNDKLLFHEKADIISFPITQFYKDADYIDEYPVIVKPVDNCGAKGISICYNKSELEVGIDVAKKFSKADKIIIERYYDNCDEVSIYGVVIDGKFICNGIIDRKIIQLESMKAPKATILYYPSRYWQLVDKYIDKFNDFFCVCGVKNAICFFQGVIFNEELYVYEGEVRLSSSQLYNVIDHWENVDRIKIMLDIVANREISVKEVIPNKNKHALIINPLLCNGIIYKIEDECLKDKEWIIKYDKYVREGDTIPDLSERVVVFGIIQIIGKSEDEIIERLNYIKRNVKVYNSEGVEMLIFE